MDIYDTSIEQELKQTFECRGTTSHVFCEHGTPTLKEKITLH